MQSFIQYKRFKEAVRAQYDRDQLKAEALRRGNDTITGQRSRRQSQALGRRQSQATTAAAAAAQARRQSQIPRALDESGSTLHGSEGHEEKEEGEKEEHEEQHERDPELALNLEKAETGHSDNSSSRSSYEESYFGNATTRDVEEVEPYYAEEDEDPTHDHELRDQLSRHATAQTRYSENTALGIALTGIHVRDRMTREGGSGQVFVVGYERDNDPLNPQNWSVARKLMVTGLVAGIAFVVGIASAIDTLAIPQAAREFGVSEVVESIPAGVYLVGFGVGGLLSGPISETVGRNPVYIVSVTIFSIWVLASALSPNIGGQIIFRFLAGFFGATPLNLCGGSLSDLWTPLERTYAFPIFANAPLTGPIFGPVMGGFIAQSHAVKWRWTEWTTLIMAGLVLWSLVFFMPETYPGTLLRWKASHMRNLTGDDRYRAEMEVRREPLTNRLKRALYRPILLTTNEPIVMLIALYLTVVYIVLFTFFVGYPYVFGDIHNIDQGLVGLCFLGIAVGIFLESFMIPFVYRTAKRDLAKLQENGGNRLPPEFRLIFAMVGAPLLTIGLFWMGWTSDGNISIWSPLVASAMVGFAIICIFISCYQYIIDSYETFAASALASVTLIRYVAAGAMTIVGIPMYNNLGVHYTLTVLACISGALIPVPYVFYKYGYWIRKHSKYAINPI